MEALESAIRNYNFDQALVLLNNGEKFPATIDKHNKATVFEVLIENKQFEILNRFAQNKIVETDVYEYETFRYTVFESLYSYLDNAPESVAFFENFITHFENIDDEIANETLLSYAFSIGAPLHVIETLANNGANLNFRNNLDENIIHQIVKYSQNRYNISPEEKEKSMYDYIEFLHNNGIDIDESNTEGKTPLMTAVIYNYHHFLQQLLEKGANPNHLDKDNCNAFLYAVRHDFSLKLYSKLCEFATPELNHTTSINTSALFEFVQYPFNDKDEAMGCLARLISDGADLHQATKLYGTLKTPLDFILEKSSRFLKTVIETGHLDINQQDDNGNTILHKVCAYQIHDDTDKAREIYKKVKLLLENGADLSITNDKDETALMLASDDNLKIKTVELLMKNQ